MHAFFYVSIFGIKPVFQQRSFDALARRGNGQIIINALDTKEFEYAAAGGHKTDIGKRLADPAFLQNTGFAVANNGLIFYFQGFTVDLLHKLPDFGTEIAIGKQVHIENTADFRHLLAVVDNVVDDKAQGFDRAHIVGNTKIIFR